MESFPDFGNLSLPVRIDIIFTDSRSCQKQKFVVFFREEENEVRQNSCLELQLCELLVLDNPIKRIGHYSDEHVEENDLDEDGDGQEEEPSQVSVACIILRWFPCIVLRVIFKISLAKCNNKLIQNCAQETKSFIEVLLIECVVIHLSVSVCVEYV